MRDRQGFTRLTVAWLGILVWTLVGSHAVHAQTVSTRLQASMGQKVVLTLHSGLQVVGRLKHGGITRVTIELGDKTLKVVIDVA